VVREIGPITGLFGSADGVQLNAQEVIHESRIGIGFDARPELVRTGASPPSARWVGLADGL